jgi:quinohemoprotein ethanol dehydrogenase
MIRVSSRTKIACLSVAGALMAWVAWAQQARKIDNGFLRKPPAEEWVTVGRDYAETHYSPLKQIDASNVKRLGLAWYFDTDSVAGRLEATPLIHNGTVYGSLTWSVLFAIDARTGKFKWRWDPEIPRQAFPPNSQNDPNRQRTGPSVCCGPVNRGVALYNGKVYAGLLDGRLVALDAETGKLVWQVESADKNRDYSITMAPRVVKGKVIVGNSGAEYAVRGYVSAYDAETGKLAWRFYTVPGDPSKPFEHKALEKAAKTWTGEWWKMGGGGTVWDGIAYDPDADLLYVGTGNGGPWLQQYRSPGGGDNLYLSSILALRPDNGDYVWHFQTTPGDNWDYTAVQQMLLADLRINGRSRKVIMQAPKNGFFYVLDRITGEFISASPYAKVTWATGIDSKTGRPVEAADARSKEGVTLSPGPGGAHNWQSMSFNPSTGLVYFPGQDSSFLYRPDPNFKYAIGGFNTGITFGFGPPPGQGKDKGKEGAAPPPPPPAPPKGAETKGAEPPPPFGGGFLVAWDPVANKERWRIPQQGAFNSGTLTTAGNLVFAGAGDRKLRAYSADKGEMLWEVEVANGFSNPSTFMLDGKQYLTIMGGGPNGKVYAFALDANTQMPYSAPPPPPFGPPPGQGKQDEGKQNKQP